MMGRMNRPWRRIWLWCALAAMGAAVPQAQALDGCELSGRNTAVCFEMRNLRSQIFILDAQRSLMTENFSLFTAVGENIERIATKLLIDHSFSGHQEGMSRVRELGQNLREQSMRRSPEVFRTANLVKAQCATCHAQEDPSSGYEWDRVFRIDWDKIVQRCNRPGANPFVCKHMNALGSHFEYFFTAERADNPSYAVAMETAQEIQRIARRLASFGDSIHEGGNGPLVALDISAGELVELARSGNIEVFARGRRINNSCLACHGE